ncbi:hypothetical protein PENSTE_c013G10195 [Penicillium steckii]|uniref:BRCT domain-containing protein n=1 Tax=Penicillium steckii TaxID=303698 RepID=A0A1V6T1V8_9EURO|nr:hypothetical protein PENSTE_c013G10195 [Penicillium steckii]
MPPQKPKQPPLRNTTFDNWVSHSTGHQVADNPYSNTTAWRDTRAEKLSRQYSTGNCLPASGREGGYYSSASASANPGAFDGTILPDSPDTDSGKTGLYRGGDGIKTSKVGSGGEYRWVSDAEAQRSRIGVKDIRSFMGVNKRKAEDQGQWTEKKLRLVNPVGGETETRSLSRDSSLSTTRSGSVSGSGSTQARSSPAHATCAEITEAQIPSPVLGKDEGKNDSETRNSDSHSISEQPQNAPRTPKSTIFTGTSIYINGTTLPKISDHKLKHLLVANGANVASYMSRKNVTHIIVAQPGTKGSGAGGGLAARKLENEISRGGWKGTKIVGVEWVLESIQAGKRLSEARFSVLNVASKGQRSVAGYFGA